VLNLIAQYLKRCAERGGLLWEYRKGMALGSPLSPIIGAFFLTELNEAFEKLGLFYKRFMGSFHETVKVVNSLRASTVGMTR
jgi:hypothetical protein